MTNIIVEVVEVQTASIEIYELQKSAIFTSTTSTNLMLQRY